MTAITFLSPSATLPNGGIKSIYKASENLNSLGVESYVCHPEDLEFSCTWFTYQVQFRKNLNFSTENDFIVIPEVWAATYGPQCFALGVKYAIYVQGGYLINTQIGPVKSEEDLKLSYEKASLIMVVSQDTAEMVSLAFPLLDKSKFIRLFPHISNLFFDQEKNSIISYMPRRLPQHSEQVCFFLKQYLPPDWRILSIDNKSELEVAELLSTSAIFMSFCDQEGYPLPPLEAAVSGNIIVGYSGQGGNEYFKKPIFRVIENGNFQSYIRQILVAINETKDGIHKSRLFQEAIKKIRDDNSLENELKFLEVFSKKVTALFR